MRRRKPFLNIGGYPWGKRALQVPLESVGVSANLLTQKVSANVMEPNA